MQHFLCFYIGCQEVTYMFLIMIWRLQFTFFSNFYFWFYHYCNYRFLHFIMGLYYIFTVIDWSNLQIGLCYTFLFICTCVALIFSFSRYYWCWYEFCFQPLDSEKEFIVINIKSFICVYLLISMIFSQIHIIIYSFEILLFAVSHFCKSNFSQNYLD